jgi:hypothetical protein
MRPAVIQRRRHPPRPIVRKQGYVDAALSSAAEQIASATVHRNNRLNDQSFALSRFVAAGLLSTERLRTTLLEAAVRSGLNEADALRTIESALRARISQ